MVSPGTDRASSEEIRAVRDGLQEKSRQAVSTTYIQKENSRNDKSHRIDADSLPIAFGLPNSRFLSHFRARADATIEKA